LATGSKSNKFGWPGQDLKGVQGLYHLQDLENMENATQQGLTRAVIVGGGLIGIEMAEMFHSRHIPVTFLVREDSFWNAVLPAEESEMINKHILDNGIDLRLNEELQEIKGLDGNVSSIVCKNSGEEIDCEFVGSDCRC
jgi:NADPH-dependent 2,4-dienoyl-CoA reductase/sulfur reductase-like enzyme